MDTIKIDIQPVSYSLTTLSINNVSVQLDKSASVGGFVFGDTISVPFQVHLTTEEYNNWGSDDTYIIDLVITKLGYTRA